MSRFVLTMVFGIIALILGFFSAIVEKNKWLLRFLAFLSLIVGVGNLLVTTNMPSPQLYMTNGDKESNNELYFEVEWPFSVYYTLLPYENPKENGVKYEESIKLNESVSVGYVPSFLGII